MSEATLAGSPRPVHITASIAEVKQALAALHGLDHAAGGRTLAAIQLNVADLSLENKTSLRVEVTGVGEGFTPASVSLVDVVLAGRAALGL